MDPCDPWLVLRIFFRLKSAGSLFEPSAISSLCLPRREKKPRGLRFDSRSTLRNLQIREKAVNARPKAAPPGTILPSSSESEKESFDCRPPGWLHWLQAGFAIIFLKTLHKNILWTFDLLPWNASQGGITFRSQNEQRDICEGRSALQSGYLLTTLSDHVINPGISWAMSAAHVIALPNWDQWLFLCLDTSYTEKDHITWLSTTN